MALRLKPLQLAKRATALPVMARRQTRLAPIRPLNTAPLNAQRPPLRLRPAVMALLRLQPAMVPRPATVKRPQPRLVTVNRPPLRQDTAHQPRIPRQPARRAPAMALLPRLTASQAAQPATAHQPHRPIRRRRPAPGTATRNRRRPTINAAALAPPERRPQPPKPPLPRPQPVMRRQLRPRRAVLIRAYPPAWQTITAATAPAARLAATACKTPATNKLPRAQQPAAPTAPAVPRLTATPTNGSAARSESKKHESGESIWPAAFFISCGVLRSQGPCPCPNGASSVSLGISERRRGYANNQQHMLPSPRTRGEAPGVRGASRGGRICHLAMNPAPNLPGLQLRVPNYLSDHINV